MAKTLADISKEMREIDFCMLATRAADGNIGGRPMSNNREVDYDGDSYFFTYQDRRIVTDISQDPKVGISLQGSAGLMGVVGKPGIFIHVEGRAEVIRDKAQFKEHWSKSLDRWFPEGPDTPGTVMIKVSAKRVHYWEGGEEGEVRLLA